MKRKLFSSSILLILMITGASAQTLSDSLHAHFNFDGNLLDESGNDHHLELESGTLTYESLDAVDSAILFDGQSSVSSISNFDNSEYDAIAISLWVKTESITSSNQTCWQGAYMGFGAYIQADTGKMMGFFDFSSSGSLLSTSPVTDNEWHHIVLQNDGGTTYMYIDGVFDGSQSDPLDVGNGGGNNMFYFGQTNQGISSYTGLLNDARIYNRILTTEEIESLYTGDPIVSVGNVVVEAEWEVNVYPNPTSHLVTVDLGKFCPEVKLRVTDARGTIVYAETAAHRRYIIFPLEMSPGLYLMSIEAGGVVRTRQVLKQ